MKLLLVVLLCQLSLAPCLLVGFSPYLRRCNVRLKNAADDETESAELLPKEVYPESDDAPASVEEDWRSFRAKLIEKGLTTTTTASTPRPPPASDARSAEFTLEETSEKTLKLDPKNLELAMSQSPSLKDELSGSWAHALVAPEVGGLLIRRPLELQIVVASHTEWGKRFRDFARVDEVKRQRDQDRKIPSMLLEKKNPEDYFFAESKDKDDASDLKSVLLYRVAKRFLKGELQRIAQKGTPDSSGRLVVDARSLTDMDKRLLDLRQQYLETWQEVILVVGHNETTGTWNGVVLNRPAATKTNHRLSAAICAALEQDGIAPTPSTFQEAFGPKFAAYVGCPQRTKTAKQKDEALMLSGVPNLEGAHELAPGLGIYRGGSQAAIHKVIAKANDPFDFKFFLGSYEWQPGELEKYIDDGLYQPAACSRAVALKQCLDLPMPMWHEVSQMLGGPIAEASNRELIKSNDDNDKK